MSAIGRHVLKLSGYAPALPTPFDDAGRVDSAAFARLCDLQIAAGATALVVGGTTGESPNLTDGEHDQLIRIAVEVSHGRVRVIAGTGSNATAHTVKLSKEAEASGADALLSVVPYYNKPTQDGLYAHFCEIAASAGLPLILYDVPSRTVRELKDETVARLAEVPRVIGLKDATGDVARPSRLRPLVGTDFRLLSGDDATALGFLAHGGDGCISVTSNVAPGLCRSMFLAWRQGQIRTAQRLAWAASRLTEALSRESNPTPVKYALSLLGLMSADVRLPLVEPTGETKAELVKVLAQLCEKHSDATIGTLGRRDATRRRVAVG